MQGERVLYQGRPSPLSSIAFLITWGGLALLPGIVATIMAANDIGTGMSAWRWWGVSIVLLALVVMRDFIRRVAVAYTITTERIHIRRGLLSRTERSTDIDRVQNVNMRQRPLERALGIGDVDFDTAGAEASQAEFVFRGIADPTGLVHRLQEYKLSREHGGTGQGL
jgi:putative membrane protein